MNAKKENYLMRIIQAHPLPTILLPAAITTLVSFRLKMIKLKVTRSYVIDKFIPLTVIHIQVNVNALLRRCHHLLLCGDTGASNNKVKISFLHRIVMI